MTRLTTITSDAHAGPPTEQYREYLPSRLHDDLDRYLKERAAARAQGIAIGSNRKGFAVFSQEFLEDFLNADERVDGGPIGGWDFDVRTKELEADGVVAEVIFPGPVNVDVETSIPFQGPSFFGDFFTTDQSLDSMWAGARAYNRWLSDRLDRRRQAGLALIPTTTELDEVIAEVRWAANAGFRGFILRQMEEGLPLLYDERYDVIWSTAEEVGLPVHFHGGVGQPTEIPSTNPAVPICNSIEISWWGYRPLWYLIYGGVLERHPRLRVVFTEVYAGWVPTVLDMMDVRYEDHWLKCKDLLPKPPSEYWYGQCFLGASFLSRPELALLDDIGPELVMFGNDYPHVEGTWPRTTDFLHEVFAGAAPETVRRVCAENAARLYGFDLAYLDSLGLQYGPEAEAVLHGEPSPAERFKIDRVASRANRPAGLVMAGPPRGYMRRPQVLK